MKLLRMLPLTLLILLVPTLAFAQTSAAPTTTLTTMAMVIMIINIVVGFIGQGIGQGNVLGIVTVPKAYVPYLTVLAAFGTSVGTALSQGDAVLPAILFALLGLATGTGISHHFGTPARTQSMIGKPPAAGGTAAGKQNAVEAAASGLMPPPAAHRGMLRASLLGLASAALVAIALLTGCLQAAPVVAPVADCASLVIVDALKGMTLAQILAAAGPSCANDVAQIINGLLGSKDAAVQATPAFVEATHVRQVLTGASK